MWRFFIDNNINIEKSLKVLSTNEPITEETGSIFKPFNVFHIYG